MNCEPDAQAVIDAFMEEVLKLGEKIMPILTQSMDTIYNAMRPIIEWWQEQERQGAVQQWLKAGPHYTPERHIRRRHHIAKLVLRYQHANR